MGTPKAFIYAVICDGLPFIYLFIELWHRNERCRKGILGPGSSLITHAHAQLALSFVCFPLLSPQLLFSSLSCRLLIAGGRIVRQAHSHTHTHAHARVHCFHESHYFTFVCKQLPPATDFCAFILYTYIFMHLVRRGDALYLPIPRCSPLDGRLFG